MEVGDLLPIFVFGQKLVQHATFDSPNLLVDGSVSVLQWLAVSSIPLSTGVGWVVSSSRF